MVAAARRAPCLCVYGTVTAWSRYGKWCRTLLSTSLSPASRCRGWTWNPVFSWSGWNQPSPALAGAAWIAPEASESVSRRVKGKTPVVLTGRQGNANPLVVWSEPFSSASVGCMPVWPTKIYLSYVARKRNFETSRGTKREVRRDIVE